MNCVDQLRLCCFVKQASRWSKAFRSGQISEAGLQHMKDVSGFYQHSHFPAGRSYQDSVVSGMRKALQAPRDPLAGFSGIKQRSAAGFTTNSQLNKGMREMRDSFEAGENPALFKRRPLVVATSPGEPISKDFLDSAGLNPWGGATPGGQSAGPRSTYLRMLGTHDPMVRLSEPSGWQIPGMPSHLQGSPRDQLAHWRILTAPENQPIVRVSRGDNLTGVLRHELGHVKSLQQPVAAQNQTMLKTVAGMQKHDPTFVRRLTGELSMSGVGTRLTELLGQQAAVQNTRSPGARRLIKATLSDAYSSPGVQAMQDPRHQSIMAHLERNYGMPKTLPS